jgi:hypothetical protein
VRSQLKQGDKEVSEFTIPAWKAAQMAARDPVFADYLKGVGTRSPVQVVQVNSSPGTSMIIRGNGHCVTMSEGNNTIVSGNGARVRREGNNIIVSGTLSPPDKEEKAARKDTTTSSGASITIDGDGKTVVVGEGNTVIRPNRD